MKENLLFVYNANRDLFSMVTDFAHKILSPSTYQCHLCSLTYGKFSINEEWKSFIESLSIETTFLYKDEFSSQHKLQTVLPAVFISTNGKVREIISRQELERCQSLIDLKNLVTVKLKEHVQHHHSNIQ
jgi:hypothetical protein